MKPFDVYRRQWSPARRVVIASLTLAALSTAVLGWTGYLSPVYVAWSVTNRLHVYFYCGDGLMRLYSFRAAEDIYLGPSPDFRRMDVHRSIDGMRCLRISHARPGVVPPYALVSQRYSPRPGAGGPTLHLAGVRTRFLPVMIVFLVYPVVAVTRRRFRYHRRRPGHCLHCQYDLTGNTSGVCPECGREILPSSRMTKKERSR